MMGVTAAETVIQCRLVELKISQTYERLQNELLNPLIKANFRLLLLSFFKENAKDMTDEK